jgi:hypothetical protein
MAYTHKPNSGSLLRNKHKADQKHPDWKGDAMVNGKLMDVAIWEGQTSGGLDRLSLSFSEPRPRDGGQSQGAPPRETGGFRPPQRREPPRSAPPPEEEEPSF